MTESQRRYAEPPPATATQVSAALTAHAPAPEVSALLVGAALHDDWRAVQDLCLNLLDGADAELAATAATCLGHLARIHGVLDVDRVRPALTARLNDPLVGGHAEDALDDLDHFLPPSTDSEPPPPPD